MHPQVSLTLPRYIQTFALLYFSASSMHFVHNAEYIAFYPNMPRWLSSEHVYLIWAVITSIGLTAVILHLLKRPLSSLVTFGIYGAFGFDALGHYAVALCSEHTLAMNATIWFEVITGTLLLGACTYHVAKSRQALSKSSSSALSIPRAVNPGNGIGGIQNKLPVLDYLQKSIAGTLQADDTTHMQYPTAISRTLKIRIVEVGMGTATVEIEASPELHGNQQGTVHGGLMCELADAAIGTAHSTLMQEGESFASIDLKINFFRPVWTSKLRAIATPIQSGKTITHYNVEIVRDDGKVAATVISAVMTLRGDKAQGR